MKILFCFIALFVLNITYSQSNIDSLILVGKSNSRNILNEIVPSNILSNNFKIDETPVVDALDSSQDRLLHLSLKEFKQTKFLFRGFAVNYNLIQKDSILTRLILPFDTSGHLLYSKKGMKEILKPYLKVLERKVKIDLLNAIEIAKKKGLSKIDYWDIDYQKRKLVWTLKAKRENDWGRKVIVINARNGKAIKQYFEIPID